MIDFHTHIFPEKIAESTLSFLASKCCTTPSFNGTMNGLLASLEESGIDCAVVLPVVTRPSQFETVNTFASNFQKPPLISFGGIHPDTGQYKEELRFIKESGMKGIKLHPDYQQVFINDIRYKRIISYASELDLIISVHSGFDPGFPECVHCSPKLAAEMFEDVKPKKLVLAHLGGFLRWDEVEEYLVGKDFYMDTAVIFGHISNDQFMRIIRNHGTDKILFATDAPWASQSEFVVHIKKLDLTKEEQKQIFHNNAAALLGLSSI